MVARDHQPTRQPNHPGRVHRVRRRTAAQHPSAAASAPAASTACDTSSKGRCTHPGGPARAKSTAPTFRSWVPAPRSWPGRRSSFSASHIEIGSRTHNSGPLRSCRLMSAMPFTAARERTLRQVRGGASSARRAFRNALPGYGVPRFAASRQLYLDFCPLVWVFVWSYPRGGTTQDFRGSADVLAGVLRNGVRRHV
jgi:hypothetical protein